MEVEGFGPLQAFNRELPGVDRLGTWVAASPLHLLLVAAHNLPITRHPSHLPNHHQPTHNPTTTTRPPNAQIQPAQESENEIAEVVIVCEPEQASLMMGGLHPRGSLYERPVNIDVAKQQHAEFRNVRGNERGRGGEEEAGLTRA